MGLGIDPGPDQDLPVAGCLRHLRRLFGGRLDRLFWLLEGFCDRIPERAPAHFGAPICRDVRSSTRLLVNKPTWLQTHVYSCWTSRAPFPSGSISMAVRPVLAEV